MCENSKGYDFWRNVLFGAKHILAPMVDQSELPFRLLARRYGCHCCYTPMINANIFIKDHKYRKECLQSSPEDRPLILQFCANNTEVLLRASRLAAPHCDAIDLNLGCPQQIAKRGHYGAFLQEEWDLIYDMLNTVSTELNIPITCKIRIFPEIEKTVAYAQMLERAGVSLICVHGRLREQKGPLTGKANWDHIKAVKKAVKIPVFANGNIQYLSDVEKCFEETGVDGVMSAEGCLHNPALFTGKNVAVWTVAEQYLQLVRQYPCPISFIRGHIFKLFHHCFTISTNEDLREKVAKAHTIEVFEEVTQLLKMRYQEMSETETHNLNTCDKAMNIPFYICQPYFRPEPKSLNPLPNLTKRPSDEEPSDASDEHQIKLSKKKLKRLNRKPIISQPVKENSKRRILCALCPNPKGEKCDYGICRQCCRKKTYLEILDCNGHRFQMKTKQDKKLEYFENVNNT